MYKFSQANDLRLILFHKKNFEAGEIRSESKYATNQN